MNKVSLFALYSPAIDQYFSKIYNTGWRDLSKARLYTSLSNLSGTLMQVRHSQPDAIPVTIIVHHEVDHSFTRPCDRTSVHHDPIMNEALKNREEFIDLQKLYDDDVDGMSERDWKRYKSLKQFYKIHEFAKFDRKTHKLTWLKEPVT